MGVVVGVGMVVLVVVRRVSAVAAGVQVDFLGRGDGVILPLPMLVAVLMGVFMLEVVVVLVVVEEERPRVRGGGGGGGGGDRC